MTASGKPAALTLGDRRAPAHHRAARPGIAQPEDAPPVDPACILVGIPALNEAAHIADCIRSLSDPRLEGARIVVADGGSSDATREIVRALGREIPGLSLIDNPGRLQSAGMNRIVEACAEPRHLVLVRCDAHSVYPDGYVLGVAASLLAREAASLATAMDATGAGCFARAAAWAVDTPLGSGGAAHRGGRRSGYVDHGHHAGVRLDWFRRIGGYDISFSHNEDAEFDHRLGDAGGRVWLDAGIRLDYRMRATPCQLALQYWRYGRGRARTIRKHRVRPQLRQAVPAVLPLAVAAALGFAPLAPALLLIPALYLAVLAASSLWIAAARRSPCGLCAGPALAIMHLAWGMGFLWQVVAAAPPGRGTTEANDSGGGFA